MLFCNLGQPRTLPFIHNMRAIYVKNTSTNSAENILLKIVVECMVKRVISQHKQKKHG